MGQIDEISRALGALQAQGEATNNRLDTITEDIANLRGNLQKFYFFVEKEIKETNSRVQGLSTEHAKASGESKANKHWATLLVAAAGGVAAEGLHFLFTFLGGKPPPHT